jgi:hypothetical protein
MPRSVALALIEQRGLISNEESTKRKGRRSPGTNPKNPESADEGEVPPVGASDLPAEADVNAQLEKLLVKSRHFPRPWRFEKLPGYHSTPSGFL